MSTFLTLVLVGSILGLPTEIFPVLLLAFALTSWAVMARSQTAAAWMVHRLKPMMQMITSVLMAIGLYVLVVFPAIPPTLGGGAPRCARLTLAREGTGFEVERILSGYPIKDVTPSNTDETARKVVELPPVLVWQMDHEWLTLKSPASLRDDQTVQVPSSQVKSIHWVGDRQRCQ
jgi:hypothetical protein